jgi:hypothetical protein
LHRPGNLLGWNILHLRSHVLARHCAGAWGTR